MTTNERFDEQFMEYRLGNHSILRGENEDAIDIKTFISTEKNLLLDQAIEELEGMEKDTQWFVDNYFTAENAYPSFDYEGEDRWVAITAKETHNLALSQAISKLKELKE